MKVKIKFSDLRELVDRSINLDDLKERYETLLKHHNDLISKSENIANLTQEIKELNDENNVLSAENNKLKSLSERKMPKFWFGDRVYKKGIGWLTVSYISMNYDEEFMYSQDGNTIYNEIGLIKVEESNEEL